jgi:transcriptional regulator with XRE-family HTH domain
MSTWTERITALRERGMTLAEIGNQCGLSPSAVSDIEQGRTKSPRGDAALRLDRLHSRKTKRRA